MTTVAVLGASGFVGREVVLALHRRGVEVRGVVAPRLATTRRDLPGVRAELAKPEVKATVERLSVELAGCDVVINAAGLAAATASGDELFGADALLPGVVAAAAPRTARVVHVSSAAVQGRAPVLDESRSVAPFSPYSRAKAVGEELALSEHQHVVCFRPTSVHGQGRPLTASLVRLLASRAASVAGSGDRPTPQVLVGNVADAAAYLAMSEEVPPEVVLQPGEGLTTAELVRLVGGREPIRVPARLARALVGLAHMVGRGSAGVAGVARRVEMLWFGQGQAAGWLDKRWSAPVGRDGWERLT